MLDRLASQHAARVLSVARDGDARAGRSAPDAAISRSWERCIANHGLEPILPRGTLVLDRPALAQRQEKLQDFVELARVEMDRLYQQIAGSGSAIILTDADGVILNCVTSPGLARMFQRAGLWLGADWSERHEGTNGIGTCVMERQPVTVHRDEHFLARHIGLSCSAAPIFDPAGNLLAVLDASTVNSRDSKQSQLHALALAAMSAKTIENCAFQRHFRQASVLRFHARPEYIGVIAEGLLAFDGDGRVLGANQSALNQLGGLSREELMHLRVADIFDLSLDVLMGRASVHATVWPLLDRRGHGYYAMLRGPESALERGAMSMPAARRSTAAARPAIPPQTAPAPGRTMSAVIAPRMDLEGLAGEDPAMAYNVRCARKVVDRNVTILLNGETGTGKEAFAKAVHDASDRADKPFVAINCASIPENLIESELFGYKAGAFTGARREGMRGKIVQAHGGTLFLDEIGDMPAHLQTRLLRVLEEREVVPLGGEAPIMVDLHVISATHRNLPDLVASGSFREDLYYRLNGLVLTLPALRERADLAIVIERVLAAEAEGQPVELSFEARNLLLEYPWPGNIRQLRNILRTAVALCEDAEIRPEDLPAELGRAPGMAGPGAAEAAPRLVSPPVETIAATDPEGSLASAEKAALLRELERHRWNMTNTARDLGLSRNTLYRKLKKHGITPPTLS